MEKITEQSLWDYLKTVKKPIVLYGMGNGAERVMDKLEEINVFPKGIFSSSGFAKNKVFRGLKLCSFEDIEKTYKDFLVLVCFGSARDEVLENINRIAKSKELYIPDVPVYGNTVFTKEYYLKHKENSAFIKNNFSDERSKEVFENIINFKLSGKLEFLKAAEDNETEVFNNILNFNKVNSVLDLGAYKGDTAEYYLNLKGNLKIFAVEPDVKNFKKLKAFAENKNIKCYNYAILNKCGDFEFGGNGGRNQTFASQMSYPNFKLNNKGIYNKNNKKTEEKDIKTVKTVTIDFLCENENINPDFIKFDIEGEELNALKGAVNTIKTKKPVLYISAYHKTEDILDIPNFVLSLNMGYKMYIRHYKCTPCWDTYYIFK